MPHGRGGAGNIQAVTKQTARVITDVEANHPQSLHTTSPTARREEQQYAHTGRGGMGNFYSPKELSEKGHFGGANTSHILGDGTPAPETTPAAVRTTGRGGVGNFMFGVSESEEKAVQKKIEEEKLADALKKDIEKGVEEQLAIPAKAKLPAEEFV